jgi:cytochrome c peroxidase
VPLALNWLPGERSQDPHAAQDGKDPHGATAMARQIAELDRLLGFVDLKQAPPGVDPRFWAATIPPDNALTPERVALGKQLYFDRRLSRDGSVACATCHDVTRAFTDLRMVSEGIGDKLGRRNAPTTLNAALLEPLFLDGRSPTLEHQAGQPILNPIEMGMTSREEVVSKLQGIPEYGPAFRAAYGREINYDDLQRAIAAFERTLVFLDAPFDRWEAGDNGAIDEAAQKGFALFVGKARCVACHHLNASNPLGVDGRFHNIGVAARKQDFEKLARQALQALAADASEQALDRLALATDLSELGRFLVSKNPSDIGAFRTLQVRNVGITPPYMHDGSMQTLWDVMDHYNKGGEDNPHLDGGIEALGLSEPEIDQVVAFLFALTDRRFAAQNQKEFERQRELARRERPFRDDELAQRKKLGFERRVLEGKETPR